MAREAKAMGTCYVVGAGEFTARGFEPGPEDFVIAADGGWNALASLGVNPQLLVGDFDSLTGAPPTGIAVERLPVEKDDTDTGAALKRGWRLGYRAFALYGCGGGRVDHLLANLQCLARLSALGATARLAARDYDAYAVTDGTLRLPLCPAGTVVSVFCHGAPARGVTLTGLRYPLSGATLTPDHPLGVSNEVLSSREAATVRVEHGTLLVIRQIC